MKSDYRKFAERQHRILGHYLLKFCWMNLADCVLVTRHQLEIFLNLEKFREERLDWIKNDLSPAFPHLEILFIEEVFSGICFSRVVISELPLPVRTEETYLKEYPWVKDLRNIIDPELWTKQLEDHINYSHVSIEEIVNLSSRAIVLKTKSSLQESNVLAVLAIGIAGLDDSTGYKNIDEVL